MCVRESKYQIETFSALLALCGGNSPVPSEFPSQRPVTRSFDVFRAWINRLINNCEAGDLRRRLAYYDVIVMQWRRGWLWRCLFVFVGAEFGLRLTMNIEQYEYMPGPNSDAGVKVIGLTNVQLMNYF